jgi:hypothetical protein
MLNAYAEVRAFTENAQFCGQAGTPICEARLNHVDGRAVFSGDTVRVEPGRRRLGVFCRMNLSIMIGDAQTFQRELLVELKADRRYRLQASMQPEPCSITLAEEPR